MHIKDPSRFPCRTLDRKAGLRTYIPAEDIEQLVWGQVDGMLSEPAKFATAIGATLDEQERLEPMADDRLARHEVRLERSERAWDNARRTYFAGELDAESFARDKEHYEREIAMLREEVERMRTAAQERRQQAERTKGVLAIAEHWAQIREALTEEERRSIVWTIVQDVTIDRADNVTITGTLSVGSTGNVMEECSNLGNSGGRYWIRTSDLCDVNAAL
jgi:hypothetical protein